MCQVATYYPWCGQGHLNSAAYIVQHCPSLSNSRATSSNEEAPLLSAARHPIRRFGAFFRRLQPPYVQHVIPLCFAKVEDFMHVRNAFRPISLLSGIFPNLLAVLLMRIHIWIGYLWGTGGCSAVVMTTAFPNRKAATRGKLRRMRQSTRTQCLSPHPPS